MSSEGSVFPVTRLGDTLFRSELTKVYKDNVDRAKSITMFSAPAPPTMYSCQPYMCWRWRYIHTNPVGLVQQGTGSKIVLLQLQKVNLFVFHPFCSNLPSDKCRLPPPTAQSSYILSTGILEKRKAWVAMV